jgi:hypothetical protein
MITNLILYIIAAIAVAYVIVLEHRATSTYVAAFKKYLMKAVVEAEIIYGGKTGKLKYATVIADVLQKFPKIQLLLDATEIDEAIEEALCEMRTLIANDEAVADFINTNLFEDSEG